jgi:electron transport complex protein RnfG
VKGNKIFLVFLLIFQVNYFLPAAFAETPEYSEQVYLTEKQALDLVFPGLAVEKKEIVPTTGQQKIIQKRLKRKVKEKSFTFYIGRKTGQEKSYALILDEQGKHFPMTFIVSLNGKAVVDQVAIMVYREKRGDEVKKKRFLDQFKNKSSRDPLEVDNDITHLTGATISSWSVTAGVKKAVVLTEELVLKDKGN